MMSEYNRIKQEKQVEEELKWLEAERSYDVQGTNSPAIRKSKEALSDKGQRDSNYLLKPFASRQDTKL